MDHTTPVIDSSGWITDKGFGLGVRAVQRRFAPGVQFLEVSKARGTSPQYGAASFNTN